MQISLSADESFIITCCGPEVHKVDLVSGQTTATLEAVCVCEIFREREIEAREHQTSLIHTLYVQDDGDIFSSALSPDNLSVVTSAESLIVTVWDLDSCTARRKWKVCERESESALSSVSHTHTLFSQTIMPVVDFAWDPTSTLIAGGCGDASVNVWDGDKGYQTHAFHGHKTLVTVVAFHPDPKK